MSGQVRGREKAVPEANHAIADSMKIGKLVIDPVSDGRVICPPDFLYPDVPPEHWEAFRNVLQGERMDIVNELGGFLIRGGDSVVLVDLGFGPAQMGEGWVTGSFIDSLKELGVKPEDVTDLILSHLHFDHIGWISVDGVPVFANARVYCDARDWNHFTSDYEPEPVELELPDGMLAEQKLAPIEDRIELWSEPGEILAGITVVDAAGHTPGHCVVVISSEGEKAMLATDVAHHQAELLRPDWQSVTDHDHERARASREAVVAELAETGMPFAASHFRNWEWARIVRDDDGAYHWQRLADGLMVPG